MTCSLKVELVILFLANQCWREQPHTVGNCHKIVKVICIHLLYLDLHNAHNVMQTVTRPCRIEIDLFSSNFVSDLESAPRPLHFFFTILG